MVQILDTTLREGEQTPGVYFDSHIKLAIAELLDGVGVDIIEAGHPAVSEGIEDAISQIAGRSFNAKIGAHARSLREDVDLALACGVDFLGIFYCVSNDRLNGVFKKTLATAIKEITDVISYAREQQPDLIIRYTPEDTVRSNFQNVLAVSSAAVEAGADIISVADTTGVLIPGTDNNMYDYIFDLRSEFANQGLHPKIAVHCHNDRGLALVNALDGYRAGASIIDVSVLGLGERAGIVDLAQLLTILNSEFGENHWNLTKLPELYSVVSDYSGIPVPVNHPVIGRNAFTHCAGIHTHAAAVNPLHYQSLDPELVGRVTEISLDHMAGMASVKYALEQIGEEPDRELASRVLARVKTVGQKGKIVHLDELRYIVNLCKEKEE